MASFFSALDQVGAGGLQRGQESEQQRGQHGNQQREQKHAPVRRRADHQRNIGGRMPCGQRIGNPQRPAALRRRRPEWRSTRFSVNSWRTSEPRAGAHGQAQRNLFAAVGRARHQHARQVGAGHQQDQAGDSEQRRGESDHGAANVVSGQAGRRQHDLHAVVVLRILLAPVPARLLFSPASARAMVTPGFRRPATKEVAGVAVFQVSAAAFELLLHHRRERKHRARRKAPCRRNLAA